MNQKYFKNTWKINQMYFGIQVLERIVLSQKKKVLVSDATLLGVRAGALRVGRAAEVFSVEINSRKDAGRQWRLTTQNVIIGFFKLHRSGGLLLGPPALNRVSWEVCLGRSGFLPVRLSRPPSMEAVKASPDSIAWPISQYKSSSLFSAWTCHISAYYRLLSSHHTPLWAAWLWFLGNLTQGWRSCCHQVQSLSLFLQGWCFSPSVIMVVFLLHLSVLLQGSASWGVMGGLAVIIGAVICKSSARLALQEQAWRYSHQACLKSVDSSAALQLEALIGAGSVTWPGLGLRSKFLDCWCGITDFEEII